MASWQARTVRALLVLAILPSCHLAALQCPDGAPPPCTRPVLPARYSVAVLTFDLLSRDSADVYLAEAIPDDIATRLGAVTRVEVKRPRGSAVARMRETRADYAPALGRTLRVRFLVEGSVRRAGAQVRVSARLVRAEDGVQAWAREYDRGTADLLIIQSEIATDVAREIVGRLLPAERARVGDVGHVDRAAVEHFRRGNYLVGQRGASLLRGLSEYDAALRLAPDFVPALSRAAYAWALASWWGVTPRDSGLARGFALADRALALDSLSSEGWMGRAMLLSVRNTADQRQAAAAMERAVALDPHNDEAWHQLAQLYGYLGRDTEALAALDRALALDPTRAISFVYRSELLQLARAWPAARATLDSAIALEPGLAFAYSGRGGVALALGDTVAARRDLQAASAAGFRRPSQEALLLMLEGRGDDARTLVTRMVAAAVQPGPMDLLYLAFACAIVGDRTTLARLLEAAPPGDLRWYGARFAVFDPYRADPVIGPLLQSGRPTPSP
jgi:TolB-like protein